MVNRQFRAICDRTTIPDRRYPGGRVRRRRTASAMSPLMLVMLAISVAACSSAGSAAFPPKTPTEPTSSAHANGGRGPAPGVTANSVTVGQVDDLGSPIPGLFKGAEDGTKAYFAYINSKGGVNGRKLILDAQDSTFQSGEVAVATGAQIHNDFALVGGFSLLDAAEKPLIDIAHVPDITLPLDTGMVSDPFVYSALPNPVNNYPLGFFKYLQHTYPQAVKKVGIIWAKATPATAAIEHTFETAMTSVGIRIVYDRGVGPFDTNFLPDIVSMKDAGVRMFISLELPDNFAAALARQMQQQNFTPINIEGAAYSSRLLALAGSAADGMFIFQSYPLYLGQDAKTIPAVTQFVAWMKKVDARPNFEIESVSGWISAELFAAALKHAGDPPTRAGLISALNKTTLFDSGGLIPLSNPAGEVSSSCFLLAQVRHGQIQRVPPTPSTGFFCPTSSGYLTSPGYHRIVRPTS